MMMIFRRYCRAVLALFLLTSLTNEVTSQVVDRRDIGDLVFSSQASTSYCSGLGGYCDWSTGSCDSCICNFRWTYSSLSQRCEEYYTGELFHRRLLILPINRFVARIELAS